MNSVVLIGRLTKEPELKFVPSTGMAVANFTLAVDKDLFGDKKQEAVKQGKATADYIYITVFGKAAENCSNYLHKGSQCGIHGRITSSNFEKNGTKQYKTGVTAERVEFLDSKKSIAKYNMENDIFTPVDDEEIPF